jgi:hypothetical protein
MVSRNCLLVAYQEYLAPEQIFPPEKIAETRPESVLISPWN